MKDELAQIEVKAEDFDLPEYESWAKRDYLHNNPYPVTWYTTSNSTTNSTSTDAIYYISYDWGSNFQKTLNIFVLDGTLYDR